MADSQQDDDQRPSQSTSSGNSEQQQQQRSGLNAAVDHLMANKADAALWITRWVTITFTFLYVFPLMPGISQSSCYQKALIANAATSALRLHQRLPPFQLTREYLAMVLLEDSAHYLLYSLIFMHQATITMALLPVALFAFLHLSSFTVILADKMGGQRGMVGNFFMSVVENYQRSILQTVAMSEIMLMPTVIFALLTGVGSILTPFIYYRFLSLRYSSRRNPYTKQMFHEIRLTTEYLVYKPQCPLFIRNLALSAISLISRLAPATAPN